jgi:hypothetical protein
MSILRVKFGSAQMLPADDAERIVDGKRQILSRGDGPSKAVCAISGRTTAEFFARFTRMLKAFDITAADCGFLG